VKRDSCSLTWLETRSWPRKVNEAFRVTLSDCR
jgi:hypothetical protein